MVVRTGFAREEDWKRGKIFVISVVDWFEPLDLLCRRIGPDVEYNSCTGVGWLCTSTVKGRFIRKSSWLIKQVAGW